MSLRIINKGLLVEQAIARRKQAAEKLTASAWRDAILETLENGQIPRASAGDGVDLSRITRPAHTNGAVAEFIGTGDFSAAWYTRQRYEVDAGRDLEPLLYPFIYNVVVDPSLPKVIEIHRLGPGGIVFEEVTEGGEVKFSHIGSSDETVRLVHHATGLEYTEDQFIYNQLWRITNFERQFGQAHNALENHIHLSPILDFNYAAANQTDGATLTSFLISASMPEKYLRTIEAAITHASADQRRGPYALLTSSADVFTVERALNRVPQQGFDMQSSAVGRVRQAIEYDGWTGTRGKKETEYDGVDAGKAYLVDLANRDMDFQSYFKHGLRRQQGNPDLSRFIMEQVVWDSRFGAFADPERAVEEITWPGADDGVDPDA